MPSLYTVVRRPHTVVINRRGLIVGRASQLALGDAPGIAPETREAGEPGEELAR